MFQDCSILILANGNHANEIYRIEMDKETQYAICSSFSEAKEKLILDKERIIFNGSYRPNDDEFLCVENFRLADEIKDAIRNPLGVTAFQQYDNAFPEIKAIFVGE